MNCTDIYDFFTGITGIFNNFSNLNLEFVLNSRRQEDRKTRRREGKTLGGQSS